MRNEKEFIEEIIGFAEKDKRIHIVGMEGSRVNENIIKDDFQDYDITFFVDDIKEFINQSDWVQVFGDIIMVQRPEDMELFDAVEKGYSYLIIYSDYIKLDLTLRNLEDLKDYLKEDSLRKILLSKNDFLITDFIPSDINYWISKPNERCYDDCCNEFWNLTSYIVKGLCRKEILYAIDHLHLLRQEILRMISWQIGINYGFNFSIGKNYKFINKYISNHLFNEILGTYKNSTYEDLWTSFRMCLQIFTEISNEVAYKLNYNYPNYEHNMKKYIEDMKNLYWKN